MAQRRINIRRAGLDETLSNLDIQVSISVQSQKFVRAKTFRSLCILSSSEFQPGIFMAQKIKQTKRSFNKTLTLETEQM